MRILVTGAAGFIASNLVDRLLFHGHEVTGIDNFDPYYDRTQKERNLSVALASPAYRFVEMDVRSVDEMGELFATIRPEAVVHLAAKAGVRSSVQDPKSYVEVNELGGLSVLEGCVRQGGVPLLYASTSSVYGKDSPIPFREDDPAIHPLSPYAASKRGGELMASTFFDLYQLPVAILRFFTVYGPRGRPDMAMFRFTQALCHGDVITLHGEDTERDFTYVDDIVDGVVGALQWLIRNRGCSTFNLGRSEPVRVRRVIELMAKALGKDAKIQLGELQPGEAWRTAAAVEKAHQAFGYAPRVSIEEGIQRWVQWIRNSKEAPCLPGDEGVEGG